MRLFKCAREVRELLKAEMVGRTFDRLSRAYESIRFDQSNLI